MLRHAWILTVLVALMGSGFAAEQQTVVALTPEEQAAADALARKQALDAIRAQMATEKATMEAIAQLGTSSWERAKVKLIRIGRPAVPFLIEAMAGKSAGAFPAEGYPLGGPRRTTRTVSLKDTAFAVLVEMFQNHSDYNGALPGKNAVAWQEFWTHHGVTVQFGKL